ncbi:glycoside hydrolase family 97 protein [Erythrobacter sp. sf7]|uniref:Glycoside hydrolase family 97 protein n=1 Tax=Erythrobacter fulvus TaxID=2987523 RepID=A0ABT5JQF1_9SPHN|nr:glycoside hydrolase family 97 protein [Erythrobacter fulvus]MDC8754301.1 glycoside hydrolase family 97 protein [Erythrobacter fulvus]
MTKQWKSWIALAAIAWAAAPAHAESLTLASPDGKIAVTVSDDNGQATYAVSYDGETVIAPSKLGMLFADHHGFERGLEIAGSVSVANDTAWEQPWGERRLVRDQHNELAVTFAATQGPARQMVVRFRAFDTGIGFRYELAEQPALAGEIAIVEELTQFAVGEDTTMWYTPSDEFNRYEYITRTGAAGTVDDAHTPATFRKASGIHFAIHEAALVDYSAMSLGALRPGTFEARLRSWQGGPKVKTRAPFKSPWRTIQIAPDAVGLINSDIILNLNEPNVLGDVSWVEPGKYIGIWWAMHIKDRTWGRDGIHGATTAETKRYIDFAAEHGFDGVLVEGWNIGWDGDWFNNGDLFRFTEAMPDYDIVELGRYAQSKGVRLIGHHETSANITNYENQMEAAFDLMRKVGARAVKTGYVADAGDVVRVDENGVRRYEWHDSQFMVGHHLRVVKAAAKRQIAINAHEPVKDTGLRRTYPNWITREGARGMEFNAWGTPPNPPSHVPMLAFTRMLAGPMDFTPGIFDLKPNERAPLRDDMPRGDPANRPQTTLAKQLALYVVLYSPLQMAADLPENYEARMDAFQFIKDVEADWEESIALAGEVGEYVAFARQGRKSKQWFLGAVTDENARDLVLPLDFLEKGKRYRAQIYRDGPDADWDTNPYDIVIEEKTVTGGDSFAVRLASSGGVAVRFIPVGK